MSTAPVPTGTLCWADLLPADQARAIAFYSELLSWTMAEPSAGAGGYAMAHVGEPSNETAVAGINAPMGSEAPPQWTIYLATGDIDATVSAVTEHGGTVAFGPFDIENRGRTAYCVDPTGAGFGLWQGGPFPGFGLFGVSGAVCWAEVYSTDVAATCAFFEHVFGMESTPLAKTPEFTYHQLGIPTNPEGRKIQFGAMQITPGRFPVGMTSGFRTYVAVNDTDAITAKAADLGAAVTQAPMDSPFGRMSSIEDLEGAAINLIDVGRASEA